MARLCRLPRPILVLVLIGSLFAAGACKTTGEPAQNEEDSAAAEEPAEDAQTAAAKPSPPKVTEDIYVEIIARSVLIRQKLAEDPAAAEKEVETLYEKSNLTFADVTEFEQKIGPSNVAILQPKIQDKIQKLLPEYR